MLEEVFLSQPAEMQGDDSEDYSKESNSRNGEMDEYDASVLEEDDMERQIMNERETH